jgi:methionyl aminopeptidase
MAAKKKNKKKKKAKLATTMPPNVEPTGEEKADENADAEKKEPFKPEPYIFYCTTEGCDKEAAMLCPTCLKLKLPAHRYCDQGCFKVQPQIEMYTCAHARLQSGWKAHKGVHAQAKERDAFRYPNFQYTGVVDSQLPPSDRLTPGPLRPQYVSPHREVPSHIGKPDYYGTGRPESELAERGNTTIHINTAEEIEGIRCMTPWSGYS